MGQIGRFAAVVGMIGGWLLGSVSGVLADDGAESLMREVWSRLRNLETEREVLDVLIVAAPEKERFAPADVPAFLRDRPRGVVYKRATRSIRYARDGADKLHVVFSEPREDRGTAVLVWRKPGEDTDDQWLFLPALKRVRRIPASSTQTFAGTDFSYEDVRQITSEPMERFQYVREGEAEIDGRPCTLVRATPKPGTVTAYGSRVIAITKDSLFPYRTSYYDPQGALWKVQDNAEPREVAPGVWRPALTEMRDVKLKETTLLSFVNREVNPAIPSEVFTQDYLERWTGE